MSQNDTLQQRQPEQISLELEQADAYAQYILSAPLDVLFILRSMVKRGCMATVYFNHGRSFFLTWLLAVSQDEEFIILDLGSDKAVNQEALESTKLIVTTNLDNVKIQFALTGVREITFENRQAFIAAIPEKVLRLQRREYFRLETSLTNPVRCQVPATGPEGSTHPLELTLLDISGGGLSLMVPTKSIGFFQTGMLLSNCRLQIPDENVIVTNLCVRSAFRVVTRSGQEHFRIGCEYVDLPGSRLNMIQRYITRVERERKAKEVGLD